MDELFGITEKKETPHTLRGKDFENENEIIFNVSKSRKSLKSYTFKVQSYIVFDQKESVFDAFELQTDELNWFYNVRQAYSYDIMPNTGQAVVELKPFEQLEKNFNFVYNESPVIGNLNRLLVIYSDFVEKNSILFFSKP
ncbi:MAG TPA: hypothetical protein VJ546_02135 [Bacillales bacterium]|nr:hypothetical protein [Bacillales bacterium]